MILKDEFYSKIGETIKPLTKSVLDTNSDMNPISEDRERPASQKEGLKYLMFSLDKKRSIPKKLRQTPDVHILLFCLSVCNILLSLTIFEFVIGYRNVTSGALLGTGQPLLSQSDSSGLTGTYGVMVFGMAVQMGLFLYVEIDYLQTKSFRIFTNQKKWRIFSLVISLIFLAIHPIPVKSFLEAEIPMLWWDSLTFTFRWIQFPLFTWAIVIQLISQGVFVGLQLLDFVYKSNRISVKSIERRRYIATVHYLIQVHPIKISLYLFLGIWAIYTFILRSLEVTVVYCLLDNGVKLDENNFNNLAIYGGSMFYTFGVIVRLSAWTAWPTLNVSRFFVYSLLVITAFWWSISFVCFRNFLELSVTESKAIQRDSKVQKGKSLRKLAGQMIVCRYKMGLLKRKNDFEGFSEVKLNFFNAKNDFKMIKKATLSSETDKFYPKVHLQHTNALLETAIRRAERDNPRVVARARNDLHLKITKELSQK